ncbi:hypothetical protein R1sor_014520 [Riccia sorocarpa]|uniref:Uncharacterized protein n=1 Tax=Riccia sorocarpa TaxID=122646 RepID=A0ABD3HDW2_9MARC
MILIAGSELHSWIPQRLNFFSSSIRCYGSRKGGGSLGLARNGQDGKKSWTVLQCRAKVRLKENGEKGTRQRSGKQEQRRLALESYRARFSEALEAELAEEMQAMTERLKNWTKQRLHDEGMAIFDLSVKPDGKLYRDTILRFYRAQGDGVLPVHHQFSQGDVIAISRKDPLEEEGSVIEGVVMERARRFLRVAVPASQSGNIDMQLKWRLDLSANRVAFERCMWAVNEFASPSIRQGTGHAGQLSVSSKSSSKSSPPGVVADTQAVIGEGLLSFRDSVLGLEFAKMKDEASSINPSAVPISLMSNPPSRIGGMQLGEQKGVVRALLQEMDLNDSQKIAIQKAMLRRLTLWQGPPGTGKTRTLVHYIKGYCKQGRRQVLACADSNVAVDNLVEGLLQQGLRVVRVGQPVKVKEKLRDSTIAAQVAAHPLMKKVHLLREEAISRRKDARQINNEKLRKAGATQATSMWEKAADLEKEALKAVLDRADVVCSTCVGAGDMVLDGRRFDACVIDEASQATEPASLIPVLRSGAETIILVGDPAQLPPTVISNDAIEAGLTKTLFERLQDCGVQPFLLDTQYRMHPVLAAWPSTTFYNNQLKSNVKPSERLIPKGLQWPNEEKPLIFIDCADGLEETTPLGNSYFNRVEALQVMEVVNSLIGSKVSDLSAVDIGVISPYSAQVRMLQDLLLRSEHEDRSRFADLEVKTVDGFQGREKEVIVISTVRANAEGRLGFVTDPRRMNVALTRAKRGLVVIGHSSTLQSSVHWKNWIEMARKLQLIVVSKVQADW